MPRTLSTVIAALAVAAAFLRLPTRTESSVTRQLENADSFTGNVLLLTAHPDDECMFFAPTILALTRLQRAEERSSRVYSMCLSAGNADGLGQVRKSELESSLDMLGIDADKRLLVDHPDLQDNFTAHWDEFTIASVLEPFVVEHDITTILTFDEQGVSGHPNHISLPKGVQQLMYTLRDIRLLRLHSLPALIKYTSILGPILLKFDLTINRFFNSVDRRGTAALERMGFSFAGLVPPPPTGPDPPVFVSGFREYWTAVQAMRQHSSQLVWFRWLYVAFSRYMWVNEWQEVTVRSQEPMARSQEPM
ncbi:hypothetical protein HMN09_00539000 [Mycena chlorophos]|uniref:N-acetylglucosaminylphosphatidylinositol deacetylase n=1 Tax=Mycena chlorophos TaxID=658473 RepID=A0A8H6WEN8_MYCCL|nr:hypothetical protein HMN09_00539000 [Mycena chlorophos]